MSQSPDEQTLTTLRELLEAYLENEDYAAAAEKCNFLLRKRKILGQDVTASVQRLLLQSLLHQEGYSKVIDWVQTHNLHKEMALYAQYRQEAYEHVSQHASKDTTLEQHLLAQSYFHLQQANPALKVYQELLQQEDSGEMRMELLTNTLAVLTSTAVPYVAAATDSSAIDEATNFLNDHPDYSDLAFNLGTLQFLTIPGEIDWLEHAHNHCENENDAVLIDCNQAWSRHFRYNNMDDLDYPDASGVTDSIAKMNESLINGKPLVSQPHAKWNTLQVRLYWYNRAVQQFRFQDYVACQESCQSLQKIVGVAGKKKSKKAAESSSTPSNLWWSSRVDVLLARVQDKQGKSADGVAKLEQRLEIIKGSPSPDAILDHAAAHVQLNLFQLQHPKATPAQKQAVLRALPESLQSKPAVVATLEALGMTTENQNKTSNPLAGADSLLTRGEYAEAAKLYSEHLSAPNGNAEELPYQMRRVQALVLSGEDDEALKLWESLQAYVDGETVPPPSPTDGESLENQALPRGSATVSLATSVQVKSKSSRSQESIMRQRAKRREAYLKKLEEKGDYDPDRPVKPNPERWIPKYERSRARRRGQQNRSAQGGGYGSQADTQHLDAAARRGGKLPASSGPSTANLKVSNGGRKGGRRR